MRRVFLLAVALAPPACSTYGRDDTKIIEVHDDAATDSGEPDGDDAAPFGDGGASADADAESGARAKHLAFITSNGYDGAGVGSATNADALCTDEASAANLQGTFRAWVSDAASSPKARFVEDGPWYRKDGILVAADLASLESGVLANPLDKSATGGMVTAAVWTGTATNGTPSGNDCQSWTSSDNLQIGSTGVPTSTDATWTNDGTLACSTMLHLYCFSQP